MPSSSHAQGSRVFQLWHHHSVLGGLSSHLTNCLGTENTKAMCLPFSALCFHSLGTEQTRSRAAGQEGSALTSESRKPTQTSAHSTQCTVPLRMKAVWLACSIASNQNTLPCSHLSLPSFFFHWFLLKALQKLSRWKSPGAWLPELSTVVCKIRRGAEIDACSILPVSKPAPSTSTYIQSPKKRNTHPQSETVLSQLPRSTSLSQRSSSRPRVPFFLSSFQYPKSVNKTVPSHWPGLLGLRGKATISKQKGILCGSVGWVSTQGSSELAGHFERTLQRASNSVSISVAICER